MTRLKAFTSSVSVKSSIPEDGSMFRLCTALGVSDDSTVSLSLMFTFKPDDKPVSRIFAGVVNKAVCVLSDTSSGVDPCDIKVCESVPVFTDVCATKYVTVKDVSIFSLENDSAMADWTENAPVLVYDDVSMEDINTDENSSLAGSKLPDRDTIDVSTGSRNDFDETL